MIKKLELFDVIARPDLFSQFGSTLYVIIPLGPNPRLVPVKHIKKSEKDFSYLNDRILSYPIAANMIQGMHVVPSVAVIGRMDENTYNISLSELPQ